LRAHAISWFRAVTSKSAVTIRQRNEQISKTVQMISISL